MEANMKRDFYRMILAVFALIVLCTPYATAHTAQQHQGGNKKASIQAIKTQGTNSQEMSGIDISAMDEPHHVLAMAYNENVARFARALRDQARRGALSSDFARAAVSEMSRSLDQANDHHREHVKTMSADVRLKMASMLKEMDARDSRLKYSLKILEKDVGEYTLNSKQIATDSDEILKQLDEMAKAHQPD
jgi:predicted transcriptional regulator